MPSNHFLYGIAIARITPCIKAIHSDWLVSDRVFARRASSAQSGFVRAHARGADKYRQVSSNNLEAFSRIMRSHMGVQKRASSALLQRITHSFAAWRV